MAEGLLLFYYFPNTSQSASLTAPLKGSLRTPLPPLEGRWHGAAVTERWLPHAVKTGQPLFSLRK